MVDVDINSIARQIERLTTGLVSLRDDMAVLTAITMRIDATMNGLLQEMRATHTQIGHMNERIRRLEHAESAQGVTCEH